MKSFGRRKVAYFHHDELSICDHGKYHQRKPFRAKLAHHLIKSLGVYESLEPVRPRLVTMTDLGQFHSDNYIAMLRFVQEHLSQEEEEIIRTEEAREDSDSEKEGSSVDSSGERLSRSLHRFNLGIIDSNPNKCFPGLLDYCRMYSTGTMGCIGRLVSGDADIAINWYGGMSHARSAAAYGGCYVNDCVLGILMLLRRFDRVMFISLDAQHSDAVEEAFYTSNQVLTISFHAKPSGDSFPGTGQIDDIGHGDGHGYSINVPLDSDISDPVLASLFKSVVTKAKASYSPQVILFQSGGNLLAGDRSSNFNLISINSHLSCLRLLYGFDIPLVALGGGGMNMANCARLWACATAVLSGMSLEELSKEIPEDMQYREYFGPEYKVLQPTIEAPAYPVDESNTIKNMKRKLLGNLNKMHKAKIPNIHER